MIKKNDEIKDITATAKPSVKRKYCYHFIPLKPYLEEIRKQQKEYYSKLQEEK